MRRGRIGAAAAVIGVAILMAGCTAQATGTPEQAPYRPVPIDSLTATMSTPVTDAIAYSSDGALAATRSESGLCLEHTEGPARKVCADLDAPIGQALFSPDGSTLAALEYYQRSYHGRLWLISTGDGSARQVRWPEFAQPSSAGATDQGPNTSTQSSSSAGGSGAAEDPAVYLSIAWTGNGDLLALAAGMPSMAATDTSAADHLIRIHPDDPADLTDLGEVSSGERRAAGTMVAGGGLALLPLLPQGDDPPDMAVVDLAAPQVRTLTLTGDVITDNAQILALAVAPDGGSALLRVVDPVEFIQAPPARLDLGDGTVSVLDGTSNLSPLAAAYSPDGSQVALIATDIEHDRNLLLVVPAEGGSTRTLTELDNEVLPGTGLGWTRTNMLVPQLAAGVLSLHGLAPTQLSG